ncbi:hypothetical protein [Parasphingopyxis sp.]|uniref:hypothetical protein n=1 Tax=Parasphingopyxis sp. TaxID=1920299 RepID=UPI00260BAFD8|nr:hypothetical protein [Parasphingopyxis sp.]
MKGKTGRPRGKGNLFTPERREHFLEELGICQNVAKAARAVGISSACAYRWRNKDKAFRAGWAEVLGQEIVLEPRRINPGGRGVRVAMVARRHDAPSEEIRAEFLAHLAMTSNVASAARHAGMCKQTAYRLFDRDAAFARQWCEALTSGYAHLEMEMLARARFGTETPKFHAGNKIAEITTYSDATALKLLLAHKDAVVRQRAMQQDVDEDDILERLDAKLAEMKVRLESADTETARPGSASDGP